MTTVHTYSQKKGEGFVKFCGLLRIYDFNDHKKKNILSHILPHVLSSQLNQKLEFEWKPEQEIYREISHATFSSDPIIHWLASTKGQLISKAKFSFEPKNEQKCFCISAPASKMGQMAPHHANY